jgi:hypothetical protein
VSITNSTITTNRIVLDGNTLDTTGSGGTASILLNGVAVAGAGGLTSSIANWAQFGANSTITFATGGGTGGSIIMCNGYRKSFHIIIKQNIYTIKLNT